MISYVKPTLIYRDQILWYTIKEGPTCLVKVLDHRPAKKRVEIVFLTSDNTCIWVDEDDLMERAVVGLFDRFAEDLKKGIL